MSFINGCSLKSSRWTIIKNYGPANGDNNIHNSTLRWLVTLYACNQTTIIRRKTHGRTYLIPSVLLRSFFIASDTQRFAYANPANNFS